MLFTVASLIIFLKFIIFFILIIIIFTFFLPVLIGAPYLPTSLEKVKKIIELADLKLGEKLVDLGCGDGRILIAAAKNGISVVGYEIDPLLCILAKRKIKKAGFENLVKIYCQSFWRINLEQFDVVIIFGAPGIMDRLEKKLLKELKIGARIISYIFPFPKWELEKKESGIFVYRKK